MLLSGAAPLPRHVEEFLRIIPASNLSQGYGKSTYINGYISILNVFIGFG